MNVDMSGEGIVTLIVFLAAFTLIGAGVGTVRGIVLGHTGWDLVGDIALGAAAGLFTGSFIASLAGVCGVIAGKAIILGLLPIRTWALASAIYNSLGFIISPILNIDFKPIEYDDNHKYDKRPNYEPPAISTPLNYYKVEGNYDNY